LKKTLREVSRREALGALGVVGAAVVAGCSSSPTATEIPTASPTPTPTAAAAGACAVSPNETIGPYPSLRDFVRSDITEGKAGLPVTLTITVVNAASACAPVANASVEIWQCDADGRYSEYNQQGYNGTALTFLRGIQTTDASGRVTFQTIYPGWYQGRATHIHVEVVLNGRSVKVTQIAFPESVTAAVYASGVYASKGQNPTSNASDMVFADGVQNELASVVGSPTSGYTATLTVGVSV
jgi:protocatechuate 3,4-dioxygenase beta subunit